MTGYSGTLSIRVSGVVDGSTSFSGGVDASFAISGLTLSAGGALTGSASGGGTLSLVVLDPVNGTQYVSEPLNFGAVPISTTLAALGLPLNETVPALGITWSETTSFNALRTQLTLTGAGSFDGIYQGYHLSGTATASGSFAATTAAYGIAPLDAVGAEGTGFGRAYSFTVTRRGSTAGSDSVVWQVAGSGAAPVDGADFAGGFLPSGVVNFAPGATTGTATVTVAGDSSFEPDEGFTVTLANAPGEVIVVTPSAAGTVLNDDATSIVSIAALDADRAEGQSGSTAFTFTLSRGGDLSGGAQVGWLVGGSGVRPADAADFQGGVLPSGTIAFAPGEASRVLTVQVAGDTQREGDEGFVVSLAPQSGAEIGTATAQGVIRADEAIDDIIAVDAGTGLALAMAPRFYDGPVAGLERELLAVVGQNVTVIADGPNWFVHTGSGDDAIRVQGGRNVLDGGTGSNFLTGAAGADSFFVDARGAAQAIWSTLVDFGTGDSATIWGLTEASATLIWQEGAGAPGYTGLTLHALLPGQPFASLTLPGFTGADLGGRLAMTSGHDAASGSDFLYLSVA